jgi:hypothetical protein
MSQLRDAVDAVDLAAPELGTRPRPTPSGSDVADDQTDGQQEQRRLDVVAGRDPQPQVRAGEEEVERDGREHRCRRARGSSAAHGDEDHDGDEHQCDVGVQHRVA